MDLDLRLAIAPMHLGEKAVLRLLDKKKSVMPLESLGFSAGNLRSYREKIRAPYGMILHAGPTGSGKSMSLYAALNELSNPGINIHTAEDPVEYTLPGINQLQVNAEIGLTFARALRSFLRLDPDVILVGEIRDLETARMALEASLTGHLLLSTLHTNDASSAVTRLVEMGIEPYLISSSLLMVCAQRLLRRLCPECKQAYEPSKLERRQAGVEEDEAPVFYRARGCDRCNRIGYFGRVAVHEILIPDDAFRAAMNEKGVTSERLKRMAVERGGMTTLYWDAMDKVRQGMCSLEEALGNVRPDEFDSRPGRRAPPVDGLGSRATEMKVHEAREGAVFEVL
jgi:type IV pilus assembly protein PilB